MCSGQVLAFSNTQSTIALKLSLFLTSFLVRFLTHLAFSDFDLLATFLTRPSNDKFQAGRHGPIYG